MDRKLKTKIDIFSDKIKFREFPDLQKVFRYDLATSQQESIRWP